MDISLKDAKRIGIMGGTFDPPHVGHLRAAIAAKNELNLDIVLMMPARAHAFKRRAVLASFEERLAMTEALVAHTEGVIASDFERNVPAPTYTVDVLKHFHARYPHAEIFFIAGSDALKSLASWHVPRELAALATFVIVRRPGEEGTQKLITTLHETYGFRCQWVDADTAFVSSSEIRTSLFDDERHPLLPERVYQVICERGLYGSDTANATQAELFPALDAEHPYSKDNYRIFKKVLKTRVNPRRYKHSKSVAKTARMLARTYGLDEDKARIAGILHDWDKDLHVDIARRIARQITPELPESLIEDMPWLLHGPTAAYTLKTTLPWIGEDVAQAIARHTSGAKDMTPLDTIIYVADIIEPGRTYGDPDGIEELRSRVGQVDIDELFACAFVYTMDFLVKNRRLLSPQSVETWNAVVKAHADIVRDFGETVHERRHAK